METSGSGESEMQNHKRLTTVLPIFLLTQNKSKTKVTKQSVVERG
jgi:hypothetical protein